MQKYGKENTFLTCKNVCTPHVINLRELKKVDLIRLDYWTRFGK